MPDDEFAELAKAFLNPEEMKELEEMNNLLDEDPAAIVDDTEVDASIPKENDTQADIEARLANLPRGAAGTWKKFMVGSKFKFDEHESKIAPSKHQSVVPVEAPTPPEKLGIGGKVLPPGIVLKTDEATGQKYCTVGKLAPTREVQCLVCKINVNSMKMWQVHSGGKKHKMVATNAGVPERVAHVCLDTDGVTVIGLNTSVEEVAKAKLDNEPVLLPHVNWERYDGPLHCPICKITISTRKMWPSHAEGKSHAFLAQRQQLDKRVEPIPVQTQRHIQRQAIAAKRFMTGSPPKRRPPRYGGYGGYNRGGYGGYGRGGYGAMGGYGRGGYGAMGGAMGGGMAAAPKEGQDAPPETLGTGGVMGGVGGWGSLDIEP